MNHHKKKSRAPASPLFDELIFAPDRESIPGARFVVSHDPGDEAEFLATIEAHKVSGVSLRRRGHDHGQWAELDLSRAGVDPTPLPSGSVLRERWQAARPILLAGAVDDLRPGTCLELYAALADAAALGKRLRGAGLAPLRSSPPVDERDLAKLELEGGAWVKSGLLSDAPGEASRRLRCGAGEEGRDDASRDAEAHREVARVAEALLPGASELAARAELSSLLQELLGVRPLYTQHIAYWNAPDGGALFHHDAFDERAEGGQRGVLYAQLEGETAWLALSSADLAERVAEYMEALEEGEAAWVRKALWPDRRDFDRVMARTRDPRALARELALPGCGLLGPLVNQGPDFTGFLADAGHGLFVHAGDVLLLPNHGLEHTAMHSVFCASESLTYSLSMALRES